MRIMTYKQATWDAMREEMQRDRSVFVMAEDIHGLGGAGGRYACLGKTVGLERTLDAPISETAIVSSAVGAALVGMRPIIDLRFADCLGVCMDEIVNQAAKSRYMFGGQGKVAMVIRCPDGMTECTGAHHSGSLEAWFSHIPGLQVICPSNPADAKGLLKTAIRNDNPVMFFDHKTLFEAKGRVPEGEYLIPFGKAHIAREGKDVTVVAYSATVNRALAAAEELENKGISAEVIDLRTLSPWDKDTVLASVGKTGRLVLAQEAVKQCGFLAEVGATVAEEAFDALKGPILRLGAPFVPVPAAPNLEDLCRVTARDIADAAVKLVK